MNKGLIAETSIVINAPIAKVWDALTRPEIIKRYMFGTKVVTDWKVGSPISWQGEWEGKPYEDKGTIQKLEQNRLLQFSHFSPLAGAPDVPENYHTVTISLEGADEGTRASLSQDNNTTEDDREHSQQNWAMMLQGLKKVLEE
jgi:uncharacterized protein YndB with AHSA1/START domain